MKIITRKLALLRWLGGLVVAVMVSGCILPPPWMRDLDPWALTNMTPDERPAEEIDWIEFEVEVSEHVKRVVVNNIPYANWKRSCNKWRGIGGSLYIGEGSARDIRPKLDMNLSRRDAGFYIGKILVPRNKYLPGYCEWRPTSASLSASFYLVNKHEARKEDEWVGGVLSPYFILSESCTDSELLSRNRISYCLTDENNELVFTNVDNHCSKDLHVGGGSPYSPLYLRSAGPVIINGAYLYKRHVNTRLKILVTPIVKNIKFIYDCRDE